MQLTALAEEDWTCGFVGSREGQLAGTGRDAPSADCAVSRSAIERAQAAIKLAAEHLQNETLPIANGLTKRRLAKRSLCNHCKATKIKGEQATDTTVQALE